MTGVCKLRTQQAIGLTAPVPARAISVGMLPDRQTKVHERESRQRISPELADQCASDRHGQQKDLCWLMDDGWREEEKGK